MARKPKQETLAGMAAPVFADVNEALDNYEDANDEWSEARSKIQKAKDMLIQRMKDQGLQVYKHNGLVAKLSKKNVDDVKVKKVGDEAKDEDAE